MEHTNSSSQTPSHVYPGARTMVLLHEKHLRSFLDVWRRARAHAVALPKTEDPSYASLETLCAHVLSAARSYMVWMCNVLDLPDPEIRKSPDPEHVESAAAEYIDHVADQWRRPLSKVEEVRFYRPEHESRWKVRYCVDAMLEHAVMHPIRHEFQLGVLLGD